MISTHTRSHPATKAVIDGRPYQKAGGDMKGKGIRQGIRNKIKDQITVQ